MALSFENVEITGIGELITEDRFGMVKVLIVIHDDASNAKISMACELPVQYRVEQTVQAVRDQTLAKLRDALAAARDGL